MFYEERVNRRLTLFSCGSVPAKPAATRISGDEAGDDLVG
jgi:hypothetical protein